jgi:hypothetical protein
LPRIRKKPGASTPRQARGKPRSATDGKGKRNATAFAYVNGRVVPAEKASVSVFDRGLVLGDGLFETLRARHGKPELLSRDYRRRVTAARRLRNRVPGAEARLRALSGERGR